MKQSRLYKLLTFFGLLVVSTFAIQLMTGKQVQAVEIPADKKTVLSAPCPASLGAGQSLATGLVWPSPENVSASSGGTNLYSGIHLCAASAVGSVSGAKLIIDTRTVTRTAGGGTLDLNPNFILLTTIPSPSSAGLSAVRGGFSQQSAGHRIDFSNLTPGNNCWSFVLEMQISGWTTTNLGRNSFCVNYTPPNVAPVGAAYVSCTKDYTNPDNNFNYQVFGWTNDPDGPINKPQKNLTVRMYIAGALRATTYANKGPYGDWFYLNHNFSDNVRRSIVITAYNPFDGKTKTLLSGQFGPCNRAPEGNVEAGNCTNITGWARDPDDLSRQVNIHVYEVASGDGYAYSPYTGSGDPGPGQYKVVNRGDVGNHGFIVPTPQQYNDAFLHTFNVYAIDTAGGTNAFIGSVEVGPCQRPVCDGATFSPSQPEVGTQFTVTAKYEYTPAAKGYALNHNMRLNVDSNGDQSFGPGETVTQNDKFSPLGNTLFNGTAIAADSPRRTDVISGNFGAPPNLGDFPVSWYLEWTLPANSTIINRYINDHNAGGQYNAYQNPANGQWYATLDCGDGSTFQTSRIPYVKVFGNDVFAGADFDQETGEAGLDGANCTTINSDAGIYTWQYINGSGDWLGSSVEYAALALGEIGEPGATNKFSTAGRRHGASNANVNRPFDLAFGNYDGGNKDVIGFYASGGRCIPNYIEKFNSASATGVGTTIVDISSLSGKQTRHYNGNVQIYGTLNRSADITIYVQGNVTITDNIVSADFGNISEIPTLFIVAGGDIGIAGDNPSANRAAVSQVDATLLTQNKVSTCTSWNATTIGPSNRVSRCDTKLTVTGGIVAGEIEFMRTIGTQSKAIKNEGPGGQSAEVINFRPELYLSQPNGWEVPGDRSFKYDYITSLPPIL